MLLSEVKVLLYLSSRAPLPQFKQLPEAQSKHTQQCKGRRRLGSRAGVLGIALQLAEGGGRLHCGYIVETSRKLEISLLLSCPWKTSFFKKECNSLEAHLRSSSVFYTTKSFPYPSCSVGGHSLLPRLASAWLQVGYSAP